MNGVLISLDINFIPIKKLSNFVEWISCPPLATGARVAHPGFFIKQLAFLIK